MSENKEILWWDRNKVNVDNVFAYNATLNIINDNDNDNEDQEWVYKGL